MTGSLLPALVAAAAIALTYLFCVRPMRRGHGCHTMPAETTTSTDTDAEIARLREEVHLLRHEAELRGVAATGAQKGGPH